jgi:hypothetical protein
MSFLNDRVFERTVATTEFDRGITLFTFFLERSADSNLILLVPPASTHLRLPNLCCVDSRRKARCVWTSCNANVPKLAKAASTRRSPMPVPLHLAEPCRSDYRSELAFCNAPRRQSGQRSRIRAPRIFLLEAFTGSIILSRSERVIANAQDIVSNTGPEPLSRQEAVCEPPCLY